MEHTITVIAENKWDSTNEFSDSYEVDTAESAYHCLLMEADDRGMEIANEDWQNFKSNILEGTECDYDHGDGIRFYFE
jgi:hypothetical protein